MVESLAGLPFTAQQPGLARHEREQIVMLVGASLFVGSGVRMDLELV